MGYHDRKHGITQITDGIQGHLSISWELDGHQARALNESLTHYLAETDQQFFQWWKENTTDPSEEATLVKVRSKPKSRSRKRS